MGGGAPTRALPGARTETRSGVRPHRLMVGVMALETSRPSRSTPAPDLCVRARPSLPPTSGAPEGTGLTVNTHRAPIEDSRPGEGAQREAAEVGSADPPASDNTTDASTQTETYAQSAHLVEEVVEHQLPVAYHRPLTETVFRVLVRPLLLPFLE